MMRMISIDEVKVSIDELKGKLDRSDDFKLVNALGEWEFSAKHIPRSLHCGTAHDALGELKPWDEIVVYCSNPSCSASVALYRFLEEHGYANVRRFAGGLEEWEEAGYQLEGEMVGR
jgi:rhodanese-related sulfurtransferase